MGACILTMSSNVFHRDSDKGCNGQNHHALQGIDSVLLLEIIETFDFVSDATQCLVHTD